MLVPEPRWLALFLNELVKGKLRMYQQSGVIEWAHHLVLVFHLSRAQWILCGWTIVLAALLEARP
jgi:hypothetical protein